MPSGRSRNSPGRTPAWCWQMPRVEAARRSRRQAPSRRKRRTKVSARNPSGVCGPFPWLHHREVFPGEAGDLALRLVWVRDRIGRQSSFPLSQYLYSGRSRARSKRESSLVYRVLSRLLRARLLRMTGRGGNPFGRRIRLVSPRTAMMNHRPVFSGTICGPTAGEFTLSQLSVRNGKAGRPSLL